MKQPEPQCRKELENQIDFLMKEYRAGNITIHDLMSLIRMAYEDFLEFHPEEMEDFINEKPGQSSSIERENERDS